MILIRNENDTELASVIENTFIQEAERMLLTKDRLIVAMVGGKTFNEVYNNFAMSKSYVWQKIHVFMADERILPRTSKERNINYVNNAFLNELVKSKKMKNNQIHEYLQTKEPDKGAKKYYQKLLSFQDHFDIILVASGEDGHLASAFPGHEILQKPEGYFFVGDSPKMPKERITATPALIAKSSTCIAAFMGESKKQALNKYLSKNTPFEQCPIRIIDNIKNTFVFTNLK